MTARWPPSSGIFCNYKTWLICLDSVGVVHPGAWWIWCSLSLPAPFSFLLLYTHSHYHALQPFLHKVSPFVWCTTLTTVHQCHSGEIIKSTVCKRESNSSWFYYLVCLSINKPDQSSLGSAQSWKGESKGIKELERTEREMVGGWGGCRKWQSKQEKGMWEGRDK